MTLVDFTRWEFGPNMLPSLLFIAYADFLVVIATSRLRCSQAVTSLAYR